MGVMGGSWLGKMGGVGWYILKSGRRTAGLDSIIGPQVKQASKKRKRFVSLRLTRMCVCVCVFDGCVCE